MTKSSRGFESALSWAVEHQQKLATGRTSPSENNTTGIWKIFIYLLCGIIFILLLIWLMVKIFGNGTKNESNNTNEIKLEVLDMINDERNSFPPLGPDE